jgi:hypothetical protein
MRVLTRVGAIVSLSCHDSRAVRTCAGLESKRSLSVTTIDSCLFCLLFSNP